MKESLFLALDQGGHASRALVFDHMGQIRSQGICEIGVSHPFPDRVEQDPEEVVASLNTAMTEVLTGLGGSHQNLSIVAGLATQRSSIVCWNRRTGRSLSPVISWQDRRASDWLNQVHEHAQEIHQITGLMLSPHYGANKLRWCLMHLPEVASAYASGVLSWGPLASYLLFRMLIDRPFLIDPANASRTLVWSLKTMNWDSKLLTMFALPAEPFPRCVPTFYQYGRLHMDARDIPVRVVTGDQSAALFASGRPRTDTAYINIGTGAFVQRPIGSHLIYAQRLLTSIVLHDGTQPTYVLEGTVNGAGAALDWLAQKLHLTDWQNQLSEWLLRDCSPPLFLNGISGLAAPYWAPDFTSRFLKPGQPWEQAVAVVESIVFLLQAILAEMDGSLPAAKQINISGGLAKLDGLCQRLADLTCTPVHRLADHEATARGTAYLLAGCPPEWPQPVPTQCFDPTEDRALDARYRSWHQAMSAALEDR